jgi:hypothetical protein
LHHPSLTIGTRRSSMKSRGTISSSTSPRYIDSPEVADMQDIDGRLRGGIPQADIDA